MKLYHLSIVAVLFSVNAFAIPRPVTLKDVTDRVSSENYFVLQNAQKVYQAKQSIQLARRNLLPKLNLWRIIESPFSARGLLGLVGDIAPFLVPNNWLRVKEERLFAEATQHGYKALWANQLLTARGLLFQSSLEERLQEGVIENYKSLQRIYEIVKSREAMGSAPPGSSRQVEIQLLAAQDEMTTLKRVIQESRSQLAFMLGFPGNDEAIPSGIQYISIGSRNPLRYDDYEAKVLSASPETKQYNALIRAADYVRRGRYFTFLGSSSLSRGTGGGIFDDLPMQDGLGFGLGPSVQIVRSQKNILVLQKDAVEETLRKDLKILVESYNVDVVARQDAVKRLSLTDQLLVSLEDRMKLGDAVEATELVQAAEAKMNALAAYHAIEVRLLLNLDRLRRMSFSDAFNNPVNTPAIP